MNSSIWSRDGILTATTNPGQSGLGSNDYERVLHIPLSLQQMQFSVIPRTLIGRGVLHFYRDAVSIFYSLRQQGGISHYNFIIIILFSIE